MKAPNLTSEQWDELIEQYVEIIIDSMDWKTMTTFVRQTLIEDCSQIQSRHELCEEIRLTYDEELLEELLDNVTTDTQPVDTSTYTYGLSEGETLSFPVHKKSS
jgi:hypothetical protein